MFKLVLNARNQRHKRLVDEQHLIFGVVQDIDKLFGEKTRVDGVADEAAARCTKVDFEVTAVVPGDGAAARLRVQPQICQRRSQRTGVARDLTPRGLLQPAGGLDRDNLCLAVKALCVFDQARNQQRFIHHLAKHGASSQLLVGCKMNKSPQSCKRPHCCLRRVHDSYLSHAPFPRSATRRRYADTATAGHGRSGPLL